MRLFLWICADMKTSKQFYVLYGIVVLLLLILLLVTGIKCTTKHQNRLVSIETAQKSYNWFCLFVIVHSFSFLTVSLLNKEIVDVKLNLELIRTSLSKTTSSSGKEMVFGSSYRAVTGLKQTLHPSKFSTILNALFLAFVRWYCCEGSLFRRNCPS